MLRVTENIIPVVGAADKHGCQKHSIYQTLKISSEAVILKFSDNQAVLVLHQLEGDISTSTNSPSYNHAAIILFSISS